MRGDAERLERLTLEEFEAARPAIEKVSFIFKLNRRLKLEKLIEGGRHIEFQVMGDAFGNVVCLGERECSVQRRHQKIIEEAPSPVVDAGLREKMGSAAAGTAPSQRPPRSPRTRREIIVPPPRWEPPEGVRQ